LMFDPNLSKENIPGAVKGLNKAYQVLFEILDVLERDAENASSPSYFRENVPRETSVEGYETTLKAPPKTQKESDEDLGKMLDTYADLHPELKPQLEHLTDPGYDLSKIEIPSGMSDEEARDLLDIVLRIRNLKRK